MSDKKILDVVIYCTSPRIDLSRNAIRNRFNLSNDLRIDRLPRELSDKIIKACEPAGYNFDPVRQGGQLYSFVRENPPRIHYYKWDPDRRLQLCLALSRIVHPTSVSFEYAARIFTDYKGNLQMVVPGPVSGSGSKAFVVDTAHDFLTEKNGKELKELLKDFEKEQLKDPIARAMFYHEYASRSYEIDVRWTFIATGIEALIHTDRYKSTRQFVMRIQRLSIDVGVGDISESEAEEMYESRCSLSHGQGFGEVTPQKLKLYKKMEDILRFTISKLILDKSFKAFLSDPEKIRQDWPV